MSLSSYDESRVQLRDRGAKLLVLQRQSGDLNITMDDPIRGQQECPH